MQNNWERDINVSPLFILKGLYFRSQSTLVASSLTISERDGKPYVYDDLRKKWLRLTPEESVRQRFIAYLRTSLGYPDYAFANEIAVPNAIRKGRTDSLVYGIGGKPWMIIEFKAEHIVLTEKDWQQLLSYNLYHKVSFLCLTNGVKLIACRIDILNEKNTFLKEIPSYQELRAYYEQNKKSGSIVSPMH